MRKEKNHAMVIRQAVADLIDERDRYRTEAAKLRVAGIALVKYLERLAAGKTAGIIQGEQVREAVQTIRNIT